MDHTAIQPQLTWIAVRESRIIETPQYGCMVINFLDYLYRQLNMSTLPSEVPNNLVLGFWVIIIIVQVLGKCMIIGNLGPEGNKAYHFGAPNN